MAKHDRVSVALLSCLLAPLLQGAAPIRGEIVGDIYTNCDYRLAADFPSEPMFRDVTYSDGTHSAPARQFYVERDIGLLSVTVANFADGPDVDPSLLDSAAAMIRRHGEVRFELSVFYDEPGIPGRQLDISLGNGRVLRASIYMARHRLYVTEATSTPNDGPALRFEQSISLIDENGTDLDTNPVTTTPTSTIGTSAGLPSRQYDCSRLHRR